MGLGKLELQDGRKEPQDIYSCINGQCLEYALLQNGSVNNYLFIIFILHI